MVDFLVELKSFTGSKPFQYASRLKWLQRNFYVFDKNWEELSKIFRISKDTELTLKIMGTEKRESLDLVLSELTRRLHNFVASALSLRDITQKAIPAWYKNDEFLESYKKRQREHFGDNEIRAFVQCLRNYMIHGSRPGIFSHWELKVNPGPIIHTFRLDKEEFLAQKDWFNQKARSYIQGLQQEKEDIESVMTAYYESIKSFHFWLFNSLQEKHASDLDWLEIERARLIEKYPEPK
jgi:hypothetical protein